MSMGALNRKGCMAPDEQVGTSPSAYEFVCEWVDVTCVVKR